MKYFIILFIFIFTVKSFSQKNNIMVGFKGGLNKSYIISDNDDYYTGLELFGSFFLDRIINKNFSVSTEILFSYTDDIHFLEFPLLVNYKIGNKWETFLGPKLDFIIDNDQNLNESGFYKFNNFGISIYLGSRYIINEYFFFELSYGHGFTEQIDDLTLELFNSTRRTVRFGLGYTF